MTYTDPQTPPPGDSRAAGARNGNATPWVVAAVVAVVAIIAVAFMVTSQTPAEPDSTAITQAQDLGRAEGALAGAQANLDMARDAASARADQTTAEAARAAGDARAAADQAAQSASDAAVIGRSQTTDTPPPEPLPQ